MRPFAISLLLLGFLSAGCSRSTQPAPEPPPPGEVSSPKPVGDNSHTSLDWPGVYSSIVPTSDGPAMETSLRIEEELTYVLRTSAAGDEQPAREHRGRFTWIDDGEAIKLLDIDSTNRPIYYEVGENYLRQMDLINRPVEGRLSELYYLRKDRTGLLDRRWVLDSLARGTVEAEKNLPYLLLSANGQRATGFAGCNSMQGTYLQTGDSLTFPPMTTTKMACPQLALEQKFLSALQTTAGFAVEGASLRLTDSRGHMVATFRESKKPD